MSAPVDGPVGGRDVAALLAAAAAERADAPAVQQRLAEHGRRLTEPLRLAVAGRTKAGKSTLLNALVGEAVAATDAGDCTRVVTWYRHGSTPAVTLHGTDGGARALPVRRVDGRLALELPGSAPEQVDRLVVDWPAERLAGITLVDTPGISAASPGEGRTAALVAPDDGSAPVADALLFLTRQVHTEDVAFLRRFQAGPDRPGARAATLTVLSRADEVGAARLDALRSASRVARRTAQEPALQAMGSAVLPVAGLVALTGRTLRHTELLALRALAAVGAPELDAMLLSADRFTRPGTTAVLPPDVRQRLLLRLGAFGIRLGTSLVRSGATDAASLAAELVRRSGLADLERAIDVQVRARAERLRTRSALDGLEWALRTAPRPGDAALWTGLEELRTGAHDLPELDLLARISGPSSPVAAELAPEAVRLLGGAGTTPAQRLGLPADAPAGDLRERAGGALAVWQPRAEDPLAPRAQTAAAAVVVRSVEGVLHELAGSAPAGAPVQPGADAGGEQEQRAEHGHRPGGQQGVPVDLGAAGDDAADDEGHRHGGHGDQAQRPAGPGTAVEHQRQADPAQDDEHPDRRQRRRQRDRDAVAHQRGRRLGVLRHRVGGQPGA